MLGVLWFVFAETESPQFPQKLGMTTVLGGQQYQLILNDRVFAMFRELTLFSSKQPDSGWSRCEGHVRLSLLVSI